jgi:RNA polymerase sigma factor (sigma-70 family)
MDWKQQMVFKHKGSCGVDFSDRVKRSVGGRKSRILQEIRGILAKDLSPDAMMKSDKLKQDILVEKAKQGDQNARDIIWKNCYFLVCWVVSKTYVPLDIVEDCVQDGMIGVPEAIASYDPNNNCKFSTYVVFHIFKRIQIYVTNNQFFLKFPSHIFVFLCKLVKYYNNNLTNDEIEKLKEIHGISDLNDFSSYPMSYKNCLDLSRSIQLCGRFDPVVETTADEKNVKSQKEIIKTILEKNLTPRQKKIIELYFGFNTEEKWSLQRIGDKYGLSKERIRQIIFKQKGRIEKALKRSFDLTENDLLN